MFLQRNAKNGHHFLMLMSCDSPNGKRMPLRGLVVRTTYHPLGQFMMGRTVVQVGSTRYTLSLSGCYGADGLSKDVPRAVYDKGTDVPAELVEAWNAGDGWNDAGAEGPALKALGLELMRKRAEGAKRKPRPEPTGRMSSAAASAFYYNDLRGRAAEHMRRCIREQWTSKQESEHWNGVVLADPRMKRAPAWVASCMIGYREAFHAMLYSQHLGWFLYVNNVGLVSRAEFAARRYSYSDCDPEKGAHCWADTGKVFHGPDSFDEEKDEVVNA